MTQIDLYQRVSLACSKLLTNAYSTSFSSGIKTLASRFHDPVYAIYGFVRLADEIVDTFHDHDKKVLFERFKKDTYWALDEKISLNPILESFQRVFHEYDMERELVDAFLYSMELDLFETQYDEAGYKRYIYGSAEVVGLMCLHVFCRGDILAYQALKTDACALGSAFQKINFLRDIKSDFEERGRVYFPHIDYLTMTEKDKKEIEADIQLDFDAGLRGINRLPHEAKKGVLLAYLYYTRLFERIKQAPLEQIKEQRIRVSDGEKLWIYIKQMSSLL
ncbi:phytoene/squalene synthase family protein [Cytophagaceae bacterium 50C-KIRBA]|uniref:Phytoene/squalene synthase family protein n=1 Tax=Aquirufa beregesia TaxID=2516556 RepID=A0ABX0EZ88_9BACT|nr:squalene/phytoene synthase family protein [Aquirufa beregesia]NGZ44812.1 phytoene/squalene synthase family protein [Aquirufa beregesia]